MPVEAIEPELAWTGERFARGLRVSVGEDGRIAAVGPAGEPAAPEAGSVLRLPGRALLPGFVDAHSHAFQRDLRGRGESFPAGAGSFWSWREAMYGLVDALDPQAFGALCRAAFSELRAAGVTTVGEFHYLHHADPEAADFRLDEVLLEAASVSGVRLVLLQAYYASAGPGRPAEGAQRRFRSPSLAAYWRQMDRLADLVDPALQSLGAVAHSLRAASPDELAALAGEASRRGLPFHLHLEEQVREIEECRAAYGRRPMEILLERVAVSPRVTAVHCTHSDPGDMARFGAAGGNVCLCPLTEANLGDGIADLPGIRAAGAGLCLGTDSNARVSMLEEARWLELVQRLARERRGVLRDEAEGAGGRVATVLLEAATAGGARALGIDAGAIRPGAWADFVAIDLASPELAGWSEDTLLESLLLGAGNRALAATCVGGAWREARSGL